MKRLLTLLTLLVAFILLLVYTNEAYSKNTSNSNFNQSDLSLTDHSELQH